MCVAFFVHMDFFSILFLTAILMLEQKASTVSMSPAPTGSPSQFSSRSPHREKRCSCENLKDRECMYFCHIGIVWVNTPSQVIPYGVGFHQMRPRRQVERCFCTYTRDPVCVTFCSLRGGSTILRSSPGILHKPTKAKEKERSSSP